MASVTWIGGNGNWTSGADWSTGSPPGPADDATIANGGTVSITNGVTVNSIVVSSSTPPGQYSLLDIEAPGSTITVSGDVSAGDGGLYIDRTSAGGGSTVSIGGTLQYGGVAIGNTALTAPTTVTLSGLDGTAGLLHLIGNTTSGSTNQATLNVQAAAPSTFVGRLYLRGDSLLQYSSGTIATIGVGGIVGLDGTAARLAVASAPSGNSALAGLTANSFHFYLSDGAAVATSAGLDLSNNGFFDILNGATLAIGGTLINTASNADIILDDLSGPNPLTKITAAGLVNTGEIFIRGGLDNTHFGIVDIAGAAPTTWTGFGSVGSNGLLEFASGGIGTIAQNGTLLLTDNGHIALASDTASDSALTGVVLNAGTLSLHNVGAFDLDPAGTLTNTGRILIDRYGGSYEVEKSNVSFATLVNSGSLSIGGVASTAASTVKIAALDNTGSIGIYRNLIRPAPVGPAFSVSGSVTNSGRIYSAFATVDFGVALTNNSAGRIIGEPVAVYLSQPSGSVNNAGSIAGIGTDAIGVKLAAGGTVTNTGLIKGSDAAVELVSGGAVTNQSGGVIAGTLNSSNAIDLAAGGIVLNQLGGTLTAGFDEITISGGVGTVINAGYIGYTSGSDYSDAGVAMSAGGVLTNESGGTIAGSFVPAVFRNVAGTVDNSGLLQGKDVGVRMWNGGTVVNQAGGRITGFNLGVDIRLAAGYVANAGTITGTGGGGAINLYSGTVLNLPGGTISGPATGIAAAAFGFGNPVGRVTVANAGSIAAGDDAIYLDGGGAVANDSGGRIVGTHSAGVIINGGAGTVTNAGVISGGTAGIELFAGGTVIDAGVIRGGAGTAISFGGSGNSLLVLDPGDVISGAVVASGTANALELGAATSTGTLGGLGASIGGFGTVNVDSAASWVLSGSNTIASGGTLTNAGTLDIAGNLVVDPATMVNSGYVSGTVTLAGGSYLDNTATGTITAAGTAVLGISSPNTVVNAETIAGGSVGIDLTAGGTISNANGGSNAALIVGGVGIEAFGTTAATVTNFGTIASVDGSTGTAVSFGGYSDLLVLEGGGTLVGTAVGGGGTLVFAAAGGAGTASGLGGQYTGFAQYAVLSGADWTLSGDNTISSGATLTDSGTLRVGGTLTVSGALVNSGAVLVGGLEDVGTGGSVNATTVLTGGNEFISSGGVASGTTVESGGLEVVLSGGATSDTAIAGGKLDLGDGAAAEGAITFSRSGGTLKIDGSTTPAATVSGFAAGDTVDETLIPFATSDTATLDADNLLTVSGGGKSVSLQFDSSVAGKSFAISDDGAGGAAVTLGPPAPSGLSLAAGSDSGVKGDNITNVAAPTINGIGTAGDTVTLFDGGTAVGSATVAADGSWSVTTAALAAGTHTLTASQKDMAGTVGQLSAPLAITIDLSAPLTVPATLSVSSGAAATPLGITAPSDPDDAAAALTVSVTALPSNGTVTLADGTTTVTLGENLTVAALTGLDFTPSSNAAGTSSDFAYAVTDVTGNQATGDATIKVGAAAPPVPPPDGFVVSSGVTLTISAGETASGIVVLSGGTLDVTSGGTVIDATVSGGGVEKISSGGLASGTTIESGGTETVVFGGVDSGTTVSGTQRVFSGGLASFTTIDSGGRQYVTLDGIASGTTVSGGQQDVSSAGLAVGTTIASGGVQNVYFAGAVASDTTIDAGGRQYVTSGGTAGGTTVESGGEEDVSSNGTASGTTIGSGGEQFVYFSGAVAVGTTIDSGGTQTVVSGGLASNTTVSGTQRVFSGGIASDTTIANGGLQYVASGGTASGTTINAGGEEDVASNGSATSTTVDSGGSQFVYFSGAVASDTTISSGGAETVASGGTASNTTIAGGTLELGIGGALGGSVTFTGSGGTLRIEGTALPVATISGFAAGDTIELSGIGFDAAGSATLGAGNVLQVSENGVLYSLHLDPNHSFSGSFTLAADGKGRTLITDPVAQSDQAGSDATIIPVASGDQTLTAVASPELFDFTNFSFGNDTIIGFDPTQDAIRLPQVFASNFATVQADLSSTAAGGALISFDPTHSITLDGLASTSLASANFRFV